MSLSPLEKLFLENNMGWMLEKPFEREYVIDSFREKLREASQEALARFGPGAPQFTEESLVAEYQINPHKARAFLQGLIARMTAPMLVLSWRILQGMHVQEVEVSYRERATFKLRIVLNSPYGDGQEDIYESSDIWDASVLRHLGIAKVNGTPVFDGFIPLKLGVERKAQLH